MSKRSTAPYVVRWRDALLADDHAALTWRAVIAAMALTLYADVKTGHNCFPGKAACAAKMRVSEHTIQRGWNELVEAGWLKIHPLPEERRKVQGALKELRFPRRNDPGADSTRALSARDPGADRNPTIPGNHDPFGPSRPSGIGEPGEGGEPEENAPPSGWTAAEERALRADGLVCSRCDEVVGFFPTQPYGSTLCGRCLRERDA